MQVSGNQPLIKPTKNPPKSGVSSDIQTRQDANGNTQYYIKGTDGKMHWSTRPYAMNPDGTPVDNKNLPGPASQGKAGMYNGVFVDEKGYPLGSVPKDWMPPSWTPPAAAGSVSVWNNDYHTLVGTETPTPYGPGMTTPTSDKGGLPIWAKTESYINRGFAQIGIDPVTGYAYLKTPPKDIVGYLFRPGKPEDAFGEGTGKFKLDGSDFPFEDYPWIDDGSPDFFERFRAWQKANPNGGLVSVYGKGEPQTGGNVRTRDARLKNDVERLNRGESPKDILASSLLSGSSELEGNSGVNQNSGVKSNDLQTILIALLAGMLMSRPGSDESSNSLRMDNSLLFNQRPLNLFG